ncbi:MAG: hypothetical protein ACE5K7_03675 [Phycisphaerae bacterium]
MPKRATARSASKTKEVLVVASKVKAYLKAKRCNTSAEAIQALSDQVYSLLDAAAKRAQANSRKTVKAQDL